MSSREKIATKGTVPSQVFIKTKLQTLGRPLLPPHNCDTSQAPMTYHHPSTHCAAPFLPNRFMSHPSEVRAVIAEGWEDVKPDFASKTKYPSHVRP
jgi:hypothetical protein